MSQSTPDAPQPDARPENVALRFLRWLIEPPVDPQPGTVRVLRWLLRATAFVVYAMFVGPTDGTGSGSAGRRPEKTAEPPGSDGNDRSDGRG